jgi:dihydroorotase-like cyclic amidohydrolase
MFGGTTTVIDFCNQTRGQSPLVGLEEWHRRAASACVDVGAHMIMLDVNDQSLADMQILITREGVTSFKLFMAYPGVLMLDDGALFKAMCLAGRHGAMSCVHAENGPVIQVLVEEAVAAGQVGPKYHSLTRPPSMEGEATHRAITIAALAEMPLYVVHLSAREALQQGRDDLSKIPNGAPGIETRLPLVYNGGVRQRGLSLHRFVALTVTNPAKLFGLFPQKGTIAVGSDGDIVLFDANDTWTIRAAEQQ